MFQEISGAFVLSVSGRLRLKHKNVDQHMNPGDGNHIPHYVFAGTQLDRLAGEASSFAACHLQHGEQHHMCCWSMMDRM